MSKFTVDYFITKFEAIPEEKWCSGHHEDDIGRHCAAGHCGERDDIHTDESQALCDLIPYRPFWGGVAQINDGLNDRYQQPTPKQRILAALRDIKAAKS
jgi:hypothetical protein